MIKVKSFFVSLLCLNCLLTQAQTSQTDYHPFAQNGKKWESQIGGIMENIYGNHIEGDTVINGEIWKKVYNYIGSPDFNNSYYAAIRDMGKKVYIIAKGSNRPRLLYDFGLKIGDLVRCGVEGNIFGCLLENEEKPDTLLGFPLIAYLKVENIDTIHVNGPYVRESYLRRFTFALLDSFKERMELLNNIVWVEEVGSGAGPFSPWLPLPPRDTFLQSCEVNKTSIFGYHSFYEGYQPTVIWNPQYRTTKSCGLYDMEGHRLSSGPQKNGLYIQNGKKKIIK